MIKGFNVNMVMFDVSLHMQYDDISAEILNLEN